MNTLHLTLPLNAEDVDKQQVQKQQEKLQERIVAFHQQCTQWRGKLDDPQFILFLQFQRGILHCFDITVKVRLSSEVPRYQHAEPPEIVEYLSGKTYTQSSHPRKSGWLANHAGWQPRTRA
jgi:hypothetical protein